MLGGNGDELL
jgi:hypothetical protein